MFAPRTRIQHLLRDHKYALLGGNGFCAVAGEGELNSNQNLCSSSVLYMLILPYPHSRFGYS